MDVVAKSLNEMNVGERSSLALTVVDALEITAEQAEEIGDLSLAQNSRGLATTIRTYAKDLVERDLMPLEFLLERGVMLLHDYQTRRPAAATLH